jgi:hypothetical protein
LWIVISVIHYNRLVYDSHVPVVAEMAAVAITTYARMSPAEIDLAAVTTFSNPLRAGRWRRGRNHSALAAVYWKRRNYLVRVSLLVLLLSE